MNKTSVFLAVLAAGLSVNAQTAPGTASKTERKAETRVISSSMEARGYLGIEMRDVTKDNFSQYGLSEVRGVAIDKVVDSSPAAKAGLQKGDVVIKFDGESVTSTRKLQRLVSEVAPDHQTRLTVLRGGKEVEVDVTVGKRDSAFEGGPLLEGFPEIQVTTPGDGEFSLKLPRIEGIPGMNNGRIESRIMIGGGRQIGIGVAPLTKQLGDFFGVADGKGLLVNEVRENSPAAKAGLKAGDIIVAADGKTLTDTPELVDAINAKKEGDVTLTVIRNKKQEAVKVTPEAAKDDGNQRRIERVIINGAPIS